MKNKKQNKYYFAFCAAIMIWFSLGSASAVFADEISSNETNTGASVLAQMVSAQQLDAQIKNIQDQIARLTKEMQDAGKTETAAVQPSVKKMTLAEIEAEVNRIVNEKDRIAKEVMAIVAAKKVSANAYAQIEETLKQISQKTNLVAGDIKVLALAESAPAKQAAPPASNEEKIKEQIAVIQGKILTLTKEMGSESTALVPGEAAPAESQVQEQAEPEITIEQPPAENVSEPIVTIKEPEAPKGLWQSFVDFLKNIFSF